MSNMVEKAVLMVMLFPAIILWATPKTRKFG